MKIVFFGLGSIGERHARLLKEHFKHDLLAFRSGKSTNKNKLGIKEVYTLKEVVAWKPDLAFVTNPTSEHMRYLIFCAKNGIDLFIEKPISHTTKGLAELVKYVKKNKIKTYVAYCLRFHPGIIWLKDYLSKNKPIHTNVYASSYMPNWRQNVKNHLNHYSAKKSMGGGAILELSHELDYLYYLFGLFKELKVNSRKISNVTLDSEDFIDALIKFDDKLFGNLHINFYSAFARREIVVDFEDHSVVVDMVANESRIIKTGKKDKVKKFKLERDDIYIDQLKYFFSNLGKGRMMNDLEDSLEVFKYIMKAKEGVK
jgi:predicted dehydrogenase